MFSKSSIYYRLLNTMHYNQVRKVLSATTHINRLTLRMRSDEARAKQLTVYGSFEDVENKNKQTYLDMIRIFINRDNVYRRGHVEFIYSALKNMESFGVQKDLDVYKSLIDVLPKGKFIPTNMFQVEFMHYPKQQQCIIDLLEQMEDNGVMPDYDMEDLLKNIFGNKGFPLRKYWRMMYWMPKFKNASPWALPNPLPDDVLELAKLALQRISSVDVQTTISIYESREIENSVDKTWIVSAQSPIQKNLMEQHSVDEPVYIEGPFTLWLKNQKVNYFVLQKKSYDYKHTTEDLDNVSNIKISPVNLQPPKKNYVQVNTTVHEQEDGTILALCATGTSSKDSLLSWVRFLETDGNPTLKDTPIVFSLRTGAREIVKMSSIKETRDLDVT